MIDTILRLDEQAVLWLSGRRRQPVDALMRLFSRIGDGYAWVALGGGLCFLSAEGVHLLSQFAAGFAVELTLYRVVKQRLSRPRPFVSLPLVTRLIQPPDEFSFPSGHTAAAFVMATIGGWTFPHLLAPLVVLAMFIGISRVYLGVHYPSDVVAGCFLGIASGSIPLLF
jgi:undecaprenyl-diphosphatase